MQGDAPWSGESGGSRPEPDLAGVGSRAPQRADPRRFALKDSFERSRFGTPSLGTKTKRFPGSPKQDCVED